MDALNKNGREASKVRRIYIPILLLLLSAPVLCRAELIQIGFSGLVDGVDDQYNLLENGVQAGSSISGYYIYDSTILDTNPLTTVGDYWHSSIPYGIYLNAGALLFQTDTVNINFLVEILNNHGAQGILDGYLIRSYNNLNINNNVIIEAISWQLTDYSGTAISSTDLPLIPPDLSTWLSENDLSISGGRGETPPCFDEPFSINGHIDSVWIVPEPSTLLMFGLGGLLLRKRH